MKKLKVKSTQFKVSSRNSLRNKECGFTIIELLVVLVVVLTIGGVIGSIFFVSLRSSRKSNQIATVRQNGNAAITQLARKIRYAEKFVGVRNGAAPFTTTNVCFVPGSSSPPVTEFDSLQVSDTDAAGVEVPTTIFCPKNTTGNQAISIDATPITDTNISKVRDCVISCVQPPNGVTTIKISFDMVDSQDVDVFENDVKPIRFETSVTMRNKQQ